MVPADESLLKYDGPVLVRKNVDAKPQKGRPWRVSPQQSAAAGPIPPPPKPKSSSADATTQENEEVLNAILPPREWTQGNQLWVQRVSSVPSTRADVLRLRDLLHTRLQQRRARETGICPVRRELYSQCFDELIRQVTISCAERGLLLLQVRDETRLTAAAYQTLYDSSVAFGVRKALQAEQGSADMHKQICGLEAENYELKKQLAEFKAKCDAAEKTENERRQVEEKKHMEEIQFLKKTNQQLKAQLDSIVPKK